MLFPRILSPCQVLGAHSVGMFLELHCGLKDAHCYSVIVMPHSSPFPFPSVISHSLLNCHTDCYYFLLFTVSHAGCARCGVSGTSCRLAASPCAGQIRAGGRNPRTEELGGIQKDHQVQLPGEWPTQGRNPRPCCYQHHAPTIWKVPSHTQSFSDVRMNFWYRTERLNLYNWYKTWRKQNKLQ